MRADRLFLDANVLFTAAHRPEGKAAFLFAHAAAMPKAGVEAAPAAGSVAPRPDAPWLLLSSAYAIEEARRNIALKFPQAMRGFEVLLQHLVTAPQPARVEPMLVLPAKDEPIWAAALAARATHLLTGDLRDFGPHMNRPGRCAGIVIQTVAQYLAGR